MNRRAILFMIVAGILVSLAVIAGPATAHKPAQGAAGEVRGRVISDGLRVRSQPNNTSAQIGLLKAAAFVTVIGKNTSSTWLLIRSDTGITGWVGSPYIALTQGTLKDVPVASESAPVGTAAPGATAVATEAVIETPCPPAAGTPGAVNAATPSVSSGVTGRIISDGLRVRSQPSSTAAQIGLLKAASVVTVLGRNASGTWFLVHSDPDLTGWVGSAYVALTTGKLADIPVRDENSAAAPVAVATAAATEGAALAETPCPPVAEATTPATQSAPVASTGVKGRVISSDGLRVRTQPSNTSVQIALLKAATLVTVIGKNASGTWLLIQSDTGITGWVGSAFVALTEGSLKDVPLADESAPVGTPSAP